MKNSPLIDVETNDVVAQLEYLGEGCYSLYSVTVDDSAEKSGQRIFKDELEYNFFAKFHDLPAWNKVDFLATAKHIEDLAQGNCLHDE